MRSIFGLPLLWSRADSAALLIFGLVVAYMAWQVLLLPFIGYANSYDFLRQSSCTGLWQFIDGVDKTHGNYLFPSRFLQFDGDIRADVCMRSVDNVFPWLATLFHEPGEILSFWQVAIWKLGFLCIGTVLLLMYAGRLRLPLCIIFAVLFTDWAYLAYANTLYMEFSVVVATFLALSTGVCLLALGERPGLGLLGLSVFALVWLGMSKQQYAPMAAMLSWLFALVVWLRWRIGRVVLLYVGLGGGLLFAFSLMNPSSTELMRTIDQANKTNTFFGAVLPAAADKPAALRLLGLPDECLADIGSSWLSKEGHRPCPAVAQVSRMKLLALFVSQPRTLLVPMYRITLGAKPLYPDYLGVIEAGDAEEAQGKLELVRTMSLSTWLSGLPPRLYVGLTCLGLLGGGLAFLILLRSFRDRDGISAGKAPLAVLSLGAFASLYALFSSVFGDGYIEMSKHAVIFGVGLTFQVVATAWWFWLMARGWARRV